MNLNILLDQSRNTGHHIVIAAQIYSQMKSTNFEFVGSVKMDLLSLPLAGRAFGIV